MSTVGGGGGSNDDDDDDDSEYDPLNEWIRRGGGGGAPGGENDGGGRRLGEEARAEGRLPISYGAVGAGGPPGGGGGRFGPMSSGDPASATTDADGAPPSSSSLSPPSPPASRDNPYLAMVTRLAPSDLISRFTSTAPPRVQDAVRSTILGLMGGMASQMKFDTRAVATGEKLANLMFQLQMTGYMFKNAEYRLGLSQSLGGGASSSHVGGGRMLPGGNEEGGGNDDDADAMRRGKLVDGSRIKVRYGGVAGGGDDDDDVGGGSKDDDGPSSFAASSGIEVEVDARAYMSELRREVRRLRDELEATKLAREEETRKDLLGYIRSLPKGELQRLTGTMSPEVLEAMKGLVSAVLSGIGEEEEGGGGEEEEEEGGGDVEGKMIGPDTVTEQSGEALAQLCMWQLVVGYNLRELEVREEFRASMMMADDDGSANEKFGGDDGGGGGGGGGPGDSDGGGAVAGGDGRDEWR
jgi:hypothetical protein